MKLGIYKNPIVFFGILAIAMGIILYANTNFQIPDVYVNRDILSQFWHLFLHTGKDFYLVEMGFDNPLYNFQTMLFQIFAWFVSIFIFLVLMKISRWQKFFELPVVKNKLFLYFWINIPILVVAITEFCMLFNTMENYISPPHDHSNGLFAMFYFGLIIFILIIYYPIVNLMYFLAYNKKLRSVFLKFLFYLLLILVFVLMFYDSFCHFSWWVIICDFFYLVWIYLITSALKFMEEKRN